MIGFCPLASGSKGNSIFFGTENTKILIDAGLSARATKQKLESININIEDIDAILISHEHGDHIQGLKVLAFQLGIPVLTNAETAKGIREYFGDLPKCKIFATGETFEFKDIEIHPFSIQHDTLDPVAFTLKTHQKKIGVCTDLGFVTPLVEHHLQGCDYLYVEANHEPSWVHASPRPQVYKQRVLGRNGHLSNESCGKLIAKVAQPNLKHVHLAHLSSECNSPEMALKIVKSHLCTTLPFEISIAPQDTLGKMILF